MNLHIGILQTDSVAPQLQQAHGDYPSMFRRLFRMSHGEEANELNLRFTDYDVRLAPPADIVCDAYVITGSKHSVYEDLPWIQGLGKFLQAALAEGRKVIGICFGHQLIAYYFGGRVAAAEAGWAVGVHSSRVLHTRPWMEDESAEVALLSSHKDQVLELPDGAEVFLSNDFCPIAGYTIGEQIITVQSHPEFDKAYARDLMKLRRTVLGDDTYQQGIASLVEPTGEQLLARWLLAFVNGGAR